MASMTTLSFKLGKTKVGVSVRQHAATSKRFSRSSQDLAWMLKRYRGRKVLACDEEDGERSDEVGKLAIGE
ncbi:hypothetical protein GYH30_005799 [Glycine max]|nr:hypothetical protein GYH30_005799 [Glycine max]